MSVNRFAMALVGACIIAGLVVVFTVGLRRGPSACDNVKPGSALWVTACGGQ